MDNNKAFAVYAAILVIATSIMIPLAYVISGAPFSWIPAPAIIAGDLALGCLTRGYCLGFFTLESGHWSLGGPES
jgi:hypothetical protein